MPILTPLLPYGVEGNFQAYGRLYNSSTLVEGTKIPPETLQTGLLMKVCNHFHIFFNGSF